ncbi:MAG: Ig-like domain-containing protein, partial [Holophagales bacterium]|nr:Ig-like domain-containing protein [Holophagales bacterium]
MSAHSDNPSRPSGGAPAAPCRAVVRAVFLGLVAGLLLSPATASAQTRLLFVGDSITQGGQGYASYRYPLYFDLLADGFDVDFVGSRDLAYNGVTPSPATYPDYFTTFDRHHQAYWGYRTDQLELVVQDAARDHQPEFVLIHLGTNDIGQLGAAGVTAAEANLQDIIGLMRLEVPTATFLLARVIPIGAGSGYGANAAQVAPLNAAIDSVAAAMDTAQSPVQVVDANAGFDLVTMMQGDQLHPNELGEQFIANAWRAALAPLLPAGNPAPTVTLTAPAPGASFLAPATVSLSADANDPNGSVSEVRFYADGQLLSTDTVAPWAFDWTSVPAGNYSLTAVAEDDQGASRTSAPSPITVLAPGTGFPIAVANASFEQPALADSALQNNSGIPDWTFNGTSQTYRGVFNPPAGSYPT